MPNEYSITCGKCQEVAPTSQWLESEAVLSGECHFQCPNCGVKIRRVICGVTSVEHDDVSFLLPDRLKIEEIA